MRYYKLRKYEGTIREQREQVVQRILNYCEKGTWELLSMSDTSLTYKSILGEQTVYFRDIDIILELYQDVIKYINSLKVGQEVAYSYFSLQKDIITRITKTKDGYINKVKVDSTLIEVEDLILYGEPIRELLSYYRFGLTGLEKVYLDRSDLYTIYNRKDNHVSQAG